MDDLILFQERIKEGATLLLAGLATDINLMETRTIYMTIAN